MEYATNVIEERHPPTKQNNMKKILSFLALFALSFSLPAQCNGTYPALVGPANTGFPIQDAGCDGFSSFPGAIGPWSSPLQWISASNGGQLDFVWSRLPAPPFPSPTYNAVMLLDINPLSTPVFVAVGTPCQIVIGAGLLYLPVSLSTFSSCQITTFAVIPPIPALTGLTIYGQGVMNDPVSTGWATTNAWKFTL